MNFGRLQEAIERRTKWRASTSNSSPKPYTPTGDRGSFIEHTEGVIRAKRSGPQNLRRDGWSEEKCRAYLVKHTQFIPRNYNYSDGLRLLGPLLQYAFGDENGDVALGIVWEFIEIERDPPYPEALFQKWKFKHLHRHEDLMLPHVPHANTISLPVVITDRLRKWREQQSSRATASLRVGPTLSEPGEPTTPQRLPDHIPASAYKKLYPNWREDAVFTSAGGQVATPYLPKQEVIHKMRWNEQHGRGGKLQSTRTLTVEDLMKEKLQQDHEEVTSSIPVRRSLSQHFKHSLNKVKAIQSTTVEENEGVPRPKFSEHLPNSIPNANFARKFGLIPPEQTLDGYHILEQKTACQKQIELDQELWEKAWEAARECRTGTGLDMTVDAGKLFSDATSNYYLQPLTPSLFYDSWNDFHFGPEKEKTGLQPPALEEINDGCSEQSIQIFSGNLGDTSLQSPELVKNIGADGKQKEEDQPPSYVRQDSLHRASDLPLRNFPIVSQSRTLRTEIVLAGASGGLLTLPASTFDPINVRAVYSIETFQPTVPLRSLIGLCSTEGTSPNDATRLAQWNMGSFYGHSRSSTCCSEILPAYLPPVDSPVNPNPIPACQLSARNVLQAHGSESLPQYEALCSEHGVDNVARVVKACTEREVLSENMSQGFEMGEKEFPAVSDNTLKLIRSKEDSVQRISEPVVSAGASIMSEERKFVRMLSKARRSPKSCSVEAVALLPHYSLKHEMASARASTKAFFDIGLVNKTTPELQWASTRNQIAPEEIPQSAKRVADQFCQPAAALKIFIHNRTYIDRSKSESPGHNRSITMDTEGSPRFWRGVQVPAPLVIIKQSKQTQSDSSQEIPIAYVSSGSSYPPPRSSSLKRRDNKDRHEIIHREEESQRVQSEIASFESANLSSGYLRRSPYDNYPDHLSESTLSPAASEAARYLAEPSTDIIGNFVAVDTSKKMANPFTGKERNRAPYNSQYAGGQSKVIQNPYEFEPGSPYDNLARQTTFTSFIGSQNGAVNSPRQHVKNAYSVGEAKTSARPNSLEIHIPTPTGRRLHRSESSPSVVPGRFPEHRRRSPSPDTIASYYYGVHDKSTMPGSSAQNSRQANNDAMYRERDHRQQEKVAQSPSRSIRSAPISERRSYEQSSRGRQQADVNLRSPTRQGHRTAPRDSDSKSHRSRPSAHDDRNSDSKSHRSRPSGQDGRDSGSPSSRTQQYPLDPYEQSHGSTKTKSFASSHQHKLSAGKNLLVTDVKDHEDQYDSPTIEPKKRSRSPMKKMFGKGGWLGNSPSEVNSFREAAAKKAAVEKKQEPSSKTSVMGKIRNKLEEFAEKADISPARSSHSKSSNKPSNIAILAVSIGPPEQARIYMELELMLVHTANAFLMSHFKQGQIAIDSIKKTFDNWKSKGRPSVVEFMYDQGTQRELIAVNQHNFRFHGERALDGIRVHSMLYNWKIVASHMVIRTFCNADTVILKLLFDIEQILELLGAAEGILLRLQTIRLSINEKILISKKLRDSDLAEKFVNGRQVSYAYGSRNPSEDLSRQPTSDDPYGGLKLVPDFYADNKS